MSKYVFETREFGVSDTGIHLLRSRFNYKTIDYKEIDSVIIEKGKDINNWLFLLIAGICMVIFAFIYTFYLVNYINDEDTRRIYIEYILVPLFPFLLGIYSIYASLKISLLLRIKTIDGKHKKFPLADLQKLGILEDFQQFLKTKLLTKLKINNITE